MPLLLVAAIGFPIWHVLSPKPWEETLDPATSVNGFDNRFPSTQYSTAPISVYSQASYSNPASSAGNGFFTNPAMPNKLLTHSNSAGTKGGVFLPHTLSDMGTGRSTLVSKEVFQAMGGTTFAFPGDASGPDLSAPPMEFVPITNLEEIIRFDVSQTWVKQRWPRVSTSPSEHGLHGLRVALVTGTNTTDLHGSLTYYFDVDQRVQRITFRGFTGDSTRLVQLLSQKYRFRVEPTHFAGLYVAKKRNVASSGLVMKHPVVIRPDNPAQQVAMALEINNPKGPFGLSASFQSVIAEASNSQ